jgi:hypothetical protein
MYSSPFTIAMASCGISVNACCRKSSARVSFEASMTGSRKATRAPSPITSAPARAVISAIPSLRSPKSPDFGATPGGFAIRHLQPGYAYRGDKTILSVTARRRRAEFVEVSEFDAGGDIVLYMSQLNLSARAYHRILKLSRTIADLSGIEEIQSAHLTEALHASQPPEIDAACLISAH